MVFPLLLALPWLGVIAFLAFVARPPSELPPARPRARTSRFVSVIVPARNESANIEACIRSISASAGVDFEIVVVDDRSDDGTADLVRSLGAGNARRLRLVTGTELPDGWLGKPWACTQGAAVAEGDLLLFTDADTRHGPDLLARAVRGLEEEDADLLTVMGRQILETFWERVVQPQIFMLMLFRFPRLEPMARSANWRNAIANGQYMLFPRASYEAHGGHAAVRDEVAEDLALAQHVKRSGGKLRIRAAQTDLGTRMYRSLPHMIEGWSKNLVMGGLQSVPPWLRLVTLPLSLLTGVTLWLAPPMVLVAALAGVGGMGLLTWSVVATGLSAAIWTAFSRLMGVPAAYGLLYPLGAAMGTYIFVRSWVRGREVEWKGRRYTLPPVSSRP
ncbi:MAG: glycosyltransferase [Longimicrobiales bacterium]